MPNRTVFSSQTAPESPQRPLATPFWPSLKPNRATSDCRSSTRSIRPTSGPTDQSRRGCGWCQTHRFHHLGEHGGPESDYRGMPGHVAGHVWHFCASVGNRAQTEVPTTALVASVTPAKARSTSPASRPSTSHWRMTMVNLTAIWRNLT